MSPGSMISRNSDAVSTGSLGSGTKPVTRTV
jgi:hypothetical protein